VDEMWTNFRLIDSFSLNFLKLLKLNPRTRQVDVKDFIHTCGLFHVKHS